jgi:pyruvate formate lyase activating enzyme
MLRVHSIETFGTHEGPGIRLVVFLQGCPLRCVYCHNPDTQACEGEKAQLYTSAEIMEWLERERPFFSRGGGLTVSGGEPTLQAEGLLELFAEAKAKGFHLALDTNGILWSPEVNRLYDLTDLVILDVKHINDGWHRKLTGSGNANVLLNAAYREQSGKPMWLRYVLVPGWTDQPQYLEAWAEHFDGYKTIERVELLPYHTLGVHKYAALGRPYALTGVEPPSPEKVEAARAIFARYLKNIVVL